MAGPEPRYGAVVGNRVTGQPPIGQFFLTGLGNLARRAPSLAVGIDQYAEHHRRIVGWPPLGSIGEVKGRQTHPFYDFPDEPHDVI